MPDPTMTDLTMTVEDLQFDNAAVYAWPCRLGWNSGAADTATLLRLYALDAGPYPQHRVPPRTLDRAIDQVVGRQAAGMRAVLVLIGDEHIPDDVLERARGVAAEAVLRVLRAQ